MKQLPLPKKDAAQRLLVDDNEITSLFQATQKQLTPQRVALSTAILGTFCYTGLRVSEVANLKLSDISIERGTLLVASGKGGKSRSLYPPDAFFVAYKDWISERSKINPNHDYAWAQGPKSRVSDDWLRKHLEEIKAIAGLKGQENIKPHSLRHWFATNMMRRGATIKQIQMALGHSDIKTTAIYLHLNEEDCKAMATLAAIDFSPQSNRTQGSNKSEVKKDEHTNIVRNRNRSIGRGFRQTRKAITS